MAKYTVKYSCGHEGIVNLTGKRDYREYRLAKMAEGLCDECKQNERQIMREVENSHNKETCLQYNLNFKKLTGTDKQKKFGTDMRYKLMAAFLENYHEDNREDIIARLLKEDRAAWWIEFADYRTPDKMKELAEILMANDKRNIIYPEDSELQTAVRLFIERDELVASVDYNYNIIQELKKYGMRWDDWTKSWRLRYDETMISLKERMVELGHKLLCAGIPIIIDDITLAEKAMNGIYEPWHHKWILWDKERELYLIKVPYGDSTMKNIRKWCKWDVNCKVWTLKGEAFRVIDDIKQMGYRISDSAEKAVEKYAKAYRIMLADDRVIKAKRTGEELHTMNAVKKEILEDLKDEA